MKYRLKTPRIEITASFLLRQKCSKDLIARGENFVNRLANTPKEFDKSWSELKAEIAEFDNVVEKLEEEYRASHIGKGTAAAGVAVGAGVAAFAPTAALAVATTFGTASTGTAIATLSGAAATNAAWHGSAAAHWLRVAVACQQEAHYWLWRVQ